MPDAWDEALDELERAALDGDPAADWAPPTDLGPLPARLAERARAVLGLQEDALARLSRQRETVAAELSAAPNAPAAARPSAVYFDALG